MKMLKFFDKEKDTVCTASWSVLVNIYKKESEGIVTVTTISHAALCPTNLDKQKVSLALQIFDEKVPPLLRQQGAHETARFVELVVKLWSMLNIRTPSVGIMKNDMNREPFKNIDDARLGFMSDMATMFKQMDTSSASQHTRVMGLTSDTSNALHMTLNGLTTLIQKLLSKMSYVLTAELQSDRLEGEFGIYRQLSGGKFHISALQVFNGLSFQRIKLFHKLEVEKQSAHENDQCCTMDITDSELDMIDACFQDATELTVIERSSLYYIAGYKTCKEKSMSTPQMWNMRRSQSLPQWYHVVNSAIQVKNFLIFHCICTHITSH